MQAMLPTESLCDLSELHVYAVIWLLSLLLALLLLG